MGGDYHLGKKRASLCSPLPSQLSPPPSPLPATAAIVAVIIVGPFQNGIIRKYCCGFGCGCGARQKKSVEGPTSKSLEHMNQHMAEQAATKNIEEKEVNSSEDEFTDD